MKGEINVVRGGKPIGEAKTSDNGSSIGGSPVFVPQLAYDDMWDAASRLATNPAT